MHRRTLSVIVVSALVASRLAAERLPVRVLTTADGLPRDQLPCVRTDNRGFVWFCTAEGLVRFDGYRAVTFGREDGFDPPGARSFLNTPDGHYWVGGDAGLFQFESVPRRDGRRFHQIVRDDHLRTGGINALATSLDGALWCGTGAGLLRLSSAANGLHLTEVDIGIPRETESDQIVRAVLEDAAGTLWVGAVSGLYERRPDGRTTRFTTRNGLPGDEVRALAVDAAGRLWAGTRRGLALIDRSAADAGARQVVGKVYLPADGIPAENILALHADGAALWVGTATGLTEVLVTTSGGLTIGRRLIGFFAQGVDRDLWGDIWVATEAGARRLSARGFSGYNVDDGLPSTRVSSVFEDRTGRVCVTTLDRRVALACFDGRSFVQMPVKAIESITDTGWGWAQLTLQDRHHRWWIPTGEGLLQFPPGPLSSLASTPPAALYGRRRGLSSDNIFRIFEDAAGGIWVATYSEAGNGIARVDTDRSAVRVFGAHDGVPFPLTIVHSFAEDRAGDIFVGLEEGRLLRYRAGRFNEVPLHDRKGWPTYDHLRALLIDSRGRLWIASTVTGVGFVEDPTAENLTVKWFGEQQGLSSNAALLLAEHSDGDLVIVTARGVDRFDVSTGGFVHFGADEGVPRGEMWGALRDRENRIWLATSSGVARLVPAKPRSDSKPMTFVTGVRVGGLPLPVPADGAQTVGDITLEPGDRRIEVDFVSPGGRSVEGLRYRHQLAGVDRGWTLTDARTIALAGIAPGRYRFVVQAVLAGGVSGPPAELRFTVLAPLWQRWWFMMLVSCTVAGLAVAFHRARVERLVEVERVRSRIAADLHDDVGASLSRIAILSEVVRRRAEPILPEAVSELTAIADNARELIDDMSDVVWFVDPSVDSLRQLVVRVRALAADLFDERGTAWALDAPEDALHIALEPEQRRHLYLILKEALTNVFRHADASNVTVRIRENNGRLTIEVADDGKGIGSLSASQQKGGHGLSNIAARAAALGGKATIDRGENGQGTRVFVDMPVRFT